MLPETLIVIITSFVLVVAVLLLFFWLFKKYFQQNFEVISDKAMNKNVKNIIELAKSELSSEKEAINIDLKNKQDSIEKLVKGLQQEINDRQKEIQQMEQSRNKSYGDITRAIAEHQKITEDLKVTTQNLGRVLSNNQSRGQWGEHIIEGLLEQAGLIENIHFLRQSPLPNSEVKPDITLLLPGKKVLAVDVKFPYQAIQRMVDAEDQITRDTEKKTFKSDVSAKLKQVEKYIDTEKGTLDYAVMFVPNEALFSFITKEFAEVINEAFKKKILIVSPFSFIPITKTVLEMHKSFTMENSLRNLMVMFADFSKQWGMFKNEFDKFDKSIKSLRDNYDQISATRFKEMDRRVKKIESHSVGQIEKEEIKLIE